MAVSNTRKHTHSNTFLQREFKVLMRRIFAAILFASFSGCTVEVDGVLQQVSGAPVDYEKFDRLVEGESTESQTLEWLGQPTKITLETSGEKLFEYISIKKRENAKETLGIRYARETQTIEEGVLLWFKGGILARKDRKR